MFFLDEHWCLYHNLLAAHSFAIASRYTHEDNQPSNVSGLKGRAWGSSLGEYRANYRVGWESSKLVLTLVACCVLLQIPAEAQVRETRRVLIINALGPSILAYPVEYRNSGIMTFMVGKDGIVYQKARARTQPTWPRPCSNTIRAMAGNQRFSSNYEEYREIGTDLPMVDHRL